MADKATQQIVDALARAAAEPAGLPLTGGKGALFPTAARELARHCKDEGYLAPVRTEARGKATAEVCRITEKGLNYLLGQTSPRRVLEDLVRALEGRGAQLTELVANAKEARDELSAFQMIATEVLMQTARAADRNVCPTKASVGQTLLSGKPDWPALFLQQLAEWHGAGFLEDCPLPELYRRAQQAGPLSIGQFHDALRTLCDQEKIYLHPWTGPLYAVPEPAFALLAGHEVAYYVSARIPESRTQNPDRTVRAAG